MGKHHNVLASPHSNPGLMLRGLNNGRSAYSIHQELVKLSLPVEFAWVERFVAGYFSKFAGISKWRQASVAEARAGRRVRTKIGRLICIPDDSIDRSLFNLPVQATGADGFKLALTSISEKLNGLDARIVHTQHDEIIVKAREDVADQVKSIMEESVEEALERIIPEVPFVVEPRVVETWR
ncbi:MAG: DNA polymerase [Syntrophobacteraceae bacterium]|jgi:DNA polymerase I-like protein with 3'-5' exonuclease and polymerase domains